MLRFVAQRNVRQTEGVGQKAYHGRTCLSASGPCECYFNQTWMNSDLHLQKTSNTPPAEAGAWLAPPEGRTLRPRHRYSQSALGVRGMLRAADIQIRTRFKFLKEELSPLTNDKWIYQIIFWIFPLQPWPLIYLGFDCHWQISIADTLPYLVFHQTGNIRCYLFPTMDPLSSQFFIKTW